MSIQLNASLLRLKLLDALRSGDNWKIDSLIEDLSSTKATTQTTDLIHLKETILHYAVQVSPLSTLQHLVQSSEKYNLDINSQDPDGNTPLHLAAAASRLEVVKYLLSLPNINDTIVNLKKKQPVELCKDLNIAQLMQFERAKFVEKLACDLRQFFSNRDFDQLEHLLVSNPRASELLDINGADPESGNTVLHEFIMKDDIQMCDWILKHGGDPFKRDKKGRLPIDLILSKNDPLRKLLKTASKDQTIMDPVINTNNAIKTGGAPTYKGYLRKWTNFASGYKLRYFVLDQYGILSYYSNQDDTNNACRGSINLGFATLHLDSSEKLKFEIIGKNGIRWHLKANHPIETNRWVWTLQNAITIAKDNIKKKNSSPPVASNRVSDVESTTNGNESDVDGISRSNTRTSVDESVTTTEGKSKHRLLHLPRRSKHKKSNSTVSDVDEISETGSGSLSRSNTFSRESNDHTRTNLAKYPGDSLLPPKGEDLSILSNAATEDFDYDIEDEDSESESYNPKSSLDDLSDPLVDQVSTVKRALDVEITSLLDLFSLVSKSEDQGNTEVYTVGTKTLKGIQDLYAKYNNLVSTRNQKLIRKLERQGEVNKLWEQSIRQLESEITDREDKLAEYEGKKKQLRKYLSGGGAKSGASTPSSVPPNSSSRDKIPTVGTLPEDPLRSDLSPQNTQNLNINQDEVLQKILEDDSDDEFFDAGDFDDDDDDNEPEQQSSGLKDKAASIGASAAGALAGAAGAVGAVGAIGASGVGSNRPTKESEGADVDSKSELDDAATAVSTDDAVPTSKENHSTEKPNESGAKTHVPVVNVENPEERSEEIRQSRSGIDAATEAQERMKVALNEEGSFLGYENPPRTKLAMDEDDRPKVGLWGILKSMIGKDMTRMTLPVSFNECTSLLQRLAEDIEYNHLLDTAASYEDSTLRTVYVAAFAASEYASTINRIAKPFNPLLGETFEYCRPDKNYRLITEQVSHHPPISACNAQSIKWDYYGENAVDSQFKGRSFDFTHLGKMFCVIRPDKGVIDKDGNKVESETYSWKKVNTSVVGIIMGNPTVDNYGKMLVTNHTTGDSIIVDMKQRGWKASSAYQLSGHVVDPKGKTHWAIGGHWNSKIFAKKVNDDSGRRDSLVDYNETAKSKDSSDPYSGQKFLVWEAAPRPKVPFNLTAFAVTLNGIDNSLKPWLPPSDTRLRPDQRAMEDGRYDEAADEKHRVEQKQRAARKEREINRETYKPNWFVKKTHPITGDNFWEYNEKYWPTRRDQKLEGCADIF
ncbi:hypothetical protein HYPBUDRAFT_152315 [Hyphopichia burtonii NRRL Y-1933]|uniref:PH domain-containing protein n=1 Tax=Hyphopichia burtonii NRRL Y-1933 TaxID=984485 RepID=A0A1E4RQ02_9ASCO|nr:hypothetical protein HYPBUDRAFT_152315 [Hyphopichia burtonii NRRL Y-1933]ODV69145.1 hypothetical protein HYPBUDRAFT_152315 [Hyphopichia burtonii NRRL Y-1933]